ENLFQNDPGIAGLVTYGKNHNPVLNCTTQGVPSTCSDQPGSAIVGAQIKISSSVIASPGYVTQTSDSNGWYHWLYKYTGKGTAFTVQWTNPGGTASEGNTQSVTLKSNGFLIVNFTIP